MNAIDPKRTNLRAVAVTFPNEDGFPSRAEPGQYEMLGSGDDLTMLLACPGCGHLSGMACGPVKPSRAPSWQLSDTPDAPTLSPSVNCVGCCGWHGYLRNGVFTSC